MTLGAEPKKLAILGAVLLMGAAGLYYDFAGGDSPAPTPSPRPVASAPVQPPAGVTSATTSAPRSGRASGEFRPRIGTRPEDHVDPATIDPQLRLDLLAKVQAVEPAAAGRNIFQFGAPPAPPKPIALPTTVPKIPVNQPPVKPPVVVTGPPAPPPPAPIPLKYYGYKVSRTDGRKVAFLMDGEEILTPSEDQTVKQRYRIVRIALTSITIEDTQSKSTQTLPLQDIPG